MSGDGGSSAGGPIDFAEVAKALKAMSDATALRLIHGSGTPRTLDDAAASVSSTPEDLRDMVLELVSRDLLRSHDGGKIVSASSKTLFRLAEDIGRLGDTGPNTGEPETTVAVAKVSRASAATITGPALVMVHGRRIGTVYPLKGDGPWTIGRGADQTIGIDYDAYASTEHCEVAFSAGQYELSDRFSTNGSFLNWERLPRGWKKPLKVGDVVGVGRSLLVFRQ